MIKKKVPSLLLLNSKQIGMLSQKSLCFLSRLKDFWKSMFIPFMCKKNSSHKTENILSRNHNSCVLALFADLETLIDTKNDCCGLQAKMVIYQKLNYYFTLKWTSQINFEGLCLWIIDLFYIPNPYPKDSLNCSFKIQERMTTLKELV